MSATVPQAEIDQILALFNSGRYAEMENRSRLLVEQYPGSGFGWKVLGASLHVQGKDALYALQKATELWPDDAEAHNNLCSVLRERGQLDGAAASCRRALEINPDFAGAHYNLGNVLQDLGQLDGAVASYQRALKIKPGYAGAYNNLGVALQGLGQFDEAVASCYRALEIKPDYPEARYNLGNALQGLGQLDDAVASYSRALEIKPDYPEAHVNLAAVLQGMGQPNGAAASCRRALEIKPDYAGAYVNLGHALQDLGQLDDAVTSYRRALEIKPDYAEAHSNLLFALNYHPDKSGEEIFTEYLAFDERFGLPHRVKWRAHSNSRKPYRRLKVGDVSPGFWHHPCRHFLEPLLAHHDKNLVEVYAYAELDREDAVTARYKEYVDHWVPTRGMTDDALAERIRADGIDILIDVAGHTAKNRLAMFARKPTPVSLHWLDFGYTTGLTAIDYYLTDRTIVPEGSEVLFSETPWFLETPGLVYRPAEGMGSTSPSPALKRGYVTFGAMIRAIRINHRIIRVWSEILKRVEGSRLMIDSGDFRDVAMQTALVEKFAGHGISGERLEIGFHSPPWNVLRELDITLDCFPHNSGTTLFETLYMGVPFVTLAGRPSVGRLGSSILEGAGHPEWIARTEDEYVEIAVALASNLTELSALRSGMRREMAIGPLMDEPAFARKVEAAYREMWIKWCETG